MLVKIESLGGQPWTFVQLSRAIKMSPATIHDGLKVAVAAGLYDPSRKLPVRRNLIEFIVHGVKYSFPPERGPIVRGVPTSYAAPPLVSIFPASTEPPPVWPFAQGIARGVSFEPLYPLAPVAAMAEPRFWVFLALIDAIRGGGARERKAAIDELTKLLPTQ